jgi:hypothetical protein
MGWLLVTTVHYPTSINNLGELVNNFGRVGFGPNWLWAELVLGRIGFGPNWFWAELTGIR